VKTAAAIQEVGKEDEIAKAHRQHEEELASFQQIMEGRVIDNDSLLQQLSEPEDVFICTLTCCLFLYTIL